MPNQNNNNSLDPQESQPQTYKVHTTIEICTSTYTRN